MMHAENKGSLVKFITCVTSDGRDLAPGAAHTYIISDIFWEKRDGKTAGPSNLNCHMLVQARMARNISILATFLVLYFLTVHAPRQVPST